MTIALYNEKYISDKEGHIISVILDIKEYEKIRAELSEQLNETQLIQPKFKDLSKLINLAGIVE